MKKAFFCLMIILGGLSQSPGQALVTMGNGVKADRSSNGVDSLLSNGIMNPLQDPYIYPNPAVDRIWVVFSGKSREIYRITLYDMNGKILFRRDYPIEGTNNKYLLVLPSGDQDTPLFLKAANPGKTRDKIFRIQRQ